MATTKGNPNTVHLGGPMTLVNDIPAIEAITPGMLVELHNNSGVPAWGVHDAEDDPISPSVALEQDEFNLGVDDAYAADDLMKVAEFTHGSTFWGFLASGENASVGSLLQSNGDGQMKILAAGAAVARALEAKDASSGALRIRVEVV